MVKFKSSGNLLPIIKLHQMQSRKPTNASTKGSLIFHHRSDIMSAHLAASFYVTDPRYGAPRNKNSSRVGEELKRNYSKFVRHECCASPHMVCAIGDQILSFYLQWKEEGHSIEGDIKGAGPQLVTRHRQSRLGPVCKLSRQNWLCPLNRERKVCEGFFFNRIKSFKPSFFSGWLN